MKPFKRIATGLGEILLGLGVIWVSRVIPNFVFEDMENIYGKSLFNFGWEYLNSDPQENIYVKSFFSKFGWEYLNSDPQLFWISTIAWIGIGVILIVSGAWLLFNYRKTSKPET